MPDDLIQADWGAVLDEMRAILIYLAKQRRTVCYSELCQLVTSARLHHRAPHFHKLLDQLSREDEAQGVPSLAALVVRKDSGIPGQGYFAIFRAEGGSPDELEAYWRQQFEQVCDYWADRV
jgi:hypothetical protein